MSTDGGFFAMEFPRLMVRRARLCLVRVKPGAPQGFKGNLENSIGYTARISAPSMARMLANPDRNQIHRKADLYNCHIFAE
jgi:hypothetical protein